MIGRHFDSFEFGPFRLEAGQRLLFRGDVQVALTPKAAHLLLILVESQGHLVEKADLLASIWPDACVEEATLAQHIHVLRKALGAGPGEILYIQTVPKRGYRFVAPVRRVAGAERALLSARSDHRLMLAVLPVDNLSGNSELEYMSDGLTEAMIHELGTVNPERLGVIARTSSMIYKGRRTTVREVARALGVHYVLEGNLRHSGERLLFGVRLICAQDQAQVWSQNYMGTLRDTLQLQTAMAGTVAKEVSARLTPRALRATSLS
jgi:TolB-like protein